MAGEYLSLLIFAVGPCILWLVFYYFESINGFVHMFTSSPLGGDGKMNIMPSNSTDNIDDIKEKIKEELKLLQPAVKLFLINPELLIWVPPQFAWPDIQEFLKKLQIPIYPNHQPSLLLHGLNKCDGQKIKEVLGDVTPVYVVLTFLNFLSCTSAGVYATHLDQVKPSTSWKHSQYIGVFILLQLQMQMVLAFKICRMP